MKSQTSPTRPCGALLILVTLLTACGGGDGKSASTSSASTSSRSSISSVSVVASSSSSSLPPPDMAGTWAGSWQGSDPKLGAVDGTWEVNLAQNDSSILGSGTLLGDIDCMEGMVSGTASGNSVYGTLNRAPCQPNGWSITDLSTSDYTASGNWSQDASKSKGTFVGRRIAVPAGPRIRSVSPSRGAPGAIVTIVGTGFDSATTVGSLYFGDSVPAALILSSSPTQIVARVPAGVSPAPLRLEAVAGRALSVRPFSADVVAPALQWAASAVVPQGSGALAFSPDGRKLYLTSPDAVAVVATPHSTPITSNGSSAHSVAQGLAVSPDGRRVYVAAGDLGIVTLDAAILQPIDGEAITGFAAGDATRRGLQVLAISPDASLLYAAENRPGGQLRIVSIGSRSVIASARFSAGMVPAAVAVHPDGSRIYVAYQDPARKVADGIAVLDAHTGQAAAPAISLGIGAAPIALAPTADGRSLFVSNSDAGSLAYIDTGCNLVLATMTGLRAPGSVVALGDGARALVATAGDDGVWQVDPLRGARSSLLLQTGNAPQQFSGLAVSPDGTQAYVATAGAGSLLEIGDTGTLTVLLAGTGYGTVNSSPPGITCGTACQARFPIGSSIALTAQPGSSSRFDGWSGAGCNAGVLSMAAGGNTCTATFTSTATVTGCFIATAAFGSPMAGEVRTLRRFRDLHLLTNAPGRRFVALYYRYSPPLADFIRPRPWLRAVFRGLLWPVIWSVRSPASAGAVAMLLLAGLACLRRLRRAQSSLDARNSAPATHPSAFLQ